MIVGLCGPAGAGKDTTADFLVKNHGFVKLAFADPLKRICQDVYQFTDAQLWGPSEMRNAPDERYKRAVNHDWFQVDAFAPGDVFKCRQCLIEAPSKKEAPCPRAYLTPRHALQQLGTEWGRYNYPNTWVDYALRVARRLQEGGCVYDVKTGLRSLSYVDADGPDGVALVRSRKDVAISDVRFRNEIDAIQAAGGKVIRLRRESTLAGSAAAHVSEQGQLGFTDDMFDALIDNTGSLGALEGATRMVLVGLRGA